jgi:uncharacterized protein YgiM (DUF1202 family)
MKRNFWLVCGLMVSTGLLAQQASNSPTAGPSGTPAPAPAATNPAASAAAAPPATGPAAPASANAPAAKAAQKKSRKKKAAQRATPRAAPTPAELKSVPLVAGPAVVGADRVNVRGQAKLHSEIVGRLTKGQPVTVLEEITLTNSAPDEPSAWAKILLPPDSHVWVNVNYVEPANKTVKATRLNVRSGPGENYSILGRLERGQTVAELATKGDWMEIEPPTNAYAFVAAQFLKQEELPVPTTTIATTTPTPPVTETPTTVVTAPTVTAPPTTETPAPLPATTEATAPTNVITAATAPTPTPAPETKVEEPPPPRIVLREGIVRGRTSIQAPSYFGLVNPENGRIIDYLYTTSTELDLRRFKGLRVVVTGQEGLDERWGNTPVLTIQKIEALSEPPPFSEPPAASQPR